MREIYTGDCETDPFAPGRTKINPFIWGLYTVGFYKQFLSTKEFVDYVRDMEIVVYIHNGGKFDFHFMLQFLDEWQEMTVINGRLAQFKIGSCEFRDSYCILPMPLSAYKKDDFDYTILEENVRHQPANWKKIEIYLKNDCVYLHELVSQFVLTYGTKLTVASSAMSFWTKNFKVKTPNSNAHFYDTFYPFYFGGRVECFQSGAGEKDFSLVDINSAYPEAMLHNHPYGTTYNVGDTLPKTREYIARAFITIECEAMGAFPFRSPKGGLFFPRDKVRRLFNVTGHEYLAALDLGMLGENPEILQVTTFTDSINFAEYVWHFYHIKENSEKGTPDYIYAKLFMNSLYGKLAADSRNYSEFTIVKPQHISVADADGYDFCAYIGDWALVEKDLDESKHKFYNIATAASITGYVRAKLLRALVQCEGVMYCDTDSIAAEVIHGLELDPKKLGAWDLEASCNYYAIAGKKLYAFRTDKIDKETGKVIWKKASKGVRLSHEEIIDVAKDMPVVHTPEVPTFSLKRGIKIIPRKITKNAHIE